MKCVSSSMKLFFVGKVIESLMFMDFPSLQAAYAAIVQELTGQASSAMELDSDTEVAAAEPTNEEHLNGTIQFATTESAEKAVANPKRSATEASSAPVELDAPAAKVSAANSDPQSPELLTGLAGGADPIAARENKLPDPTSSPVVLSLSTSAGGQALLAASSTNKKPVAPHHCPVCRQKFTKPFSGPCGHVACYLCWANVDYQCAVCHAKHKRQQLKQKFFA